MTAPNRLRETLREMNKSGHLAFVGIIDGEPTYRLSHFGREFYTATLATRPTQHRSFYLTLLAFDEQTFNRYDILRNLGAMRCKTPR